ncbi:hypothetical protein GCM10029992_26710 [Glycomyces albus]
MSQDAGLRGRSLELAYFGQTVVHGADIAVEPGEVTALLGPNGSGKSTVLRALARLHRPESGDVALDDGVPAAALSPKAFARRVALLSQSRPVPGGVRVVDVVGYGRHPYRGRWKAGDEGGPAAVERAMDICGITDMASRGVDSSPAASASASGSPHAWPRTPACSCSTSRPTTSTCAIRSRSST